MRRAFAVATTGPARAGGGRRAGGRLPRHLRPSRRRLRGRPGLRGAPACAAGPDAQRSPNAPRRSWPSAERPLVLAGGGVHICRRGRRADRVRARAQHPGRAHHDRQGRDSLHRPAQRRPVRPLRPHRQRADRGIRSAARDRLQARRDRDQALHRAAARQDADPPRHRGGGDSAARSTPDVALWGDARAGIEDLRRRAGAEAARSGARRRLCRPSVARAHGRMARRATRERYTVRRRSRSAWAASWASSTRCMPADGILVADGGFAAHWGGLLYDTKQAGRGFVPDRGFASIGYGLPGAMGAALAAPGRKVVEPHRRRRLQHDARRARDGAPDGPRPSRSSSSTTRPPATSRRCST